MQGRQIGLTSYPSPRSDQSWSRQSGTQAPAFLAAQVPARSSRKTAAENARRGSQGSPGFLPGWTHPGSRFFPYGKETAPTIISAGTAAGVLPAKSWPLGGKVTSETPFQSIQRGVHCRDVKGHRWNKREPVTFSYVYFYKYCLQQVILMFYFRE